MPTLSYPGTPGTTLYAGLPTPSGGTLLTSFSLDNWDASNASRTLFRGGMPFAMGDVPTGSVPEIRRAGGAPVVAQFDERTTWSDGSLKFAVCHMRDTDLAASGSQEYEVYSVSGSFDNTGATTLASVVASDALTVEFSSLAEWNGTSSATRGAGAALAAFATHAGVATRVTKIHSGPVCEGWQVWGMAKDGADGSGSEDAHLKAIWYVDVWKDATDAVIDTEFACELAQDWWAVADKFRLDYTATLKRNGTTVQAYTGIQHPYHSHWMTVRMQDDNSHGRRHWVGDVPSLVYKFDKAYWKSTGLVPPYDSTYTPAATSAVTYVPLGNMDHRAAIDGTGGYQGRGMFTNIDAKAYMRQTAADNRSMRTNAFAGLHITYHFRDQSTRTRPSESADIANSLIPLLLTPKDASVSTITGLPAPRDAYKNTDYVTASGGGGVWVTSSDSSHAAAYSTFAYMLEGERYMLETVIDLATATIQKMSVSQFAATPFLPWYNNTSARAEMSIPATVWYAIPEYGVGQERAMGFSSNLLGHAAALTPDNDPQGTYLRVWNSHCADYLADALTFMPPSLKAAGIPFQGLNGPGSYRSHWMEAFIVQGCYQNFRMTEVAPYADFGEMISTMLMGIADRALYDLNQQRIAVASSARDYASGDPYETADGYWATAGGTVASNVVSCAGNYDWTTDDEVVFLNYNDSAGVVAIPPEATAGQVFYVVNPTGRASFQLSLTKNGAVTPISNGSYIMGQRRYGGISVALATNPPLLPLADSSPSICIAAFTYAELEGSANVTPGTTQRVIDFMANSDRTTYPTWVMTP